MNKNKPIAGQQLQRLFTIDRTAERAVDAEARTVQVAFASELPYERYWGIEILKCAPDACDMSRMVDGAAVLWNHNSDDQIGVVEKAWIDSDSVCRAVIRFSKSARGEEMLQDVIDGIRGKISVGYRINEAVLTKTGEEGPDEYTITRWMPYEISLVSVPADATVGVGRSADAEAEVAPEVVVPEVPEQEAPKPTPIVITTERKKMNEDEIRQAALVAERQRVADIGAIAERTGANDLAKTFINSGKSVDEFRAALVERMPAPAASPAASGAVIGLTEKEARQYSFRKAILAVAENDWSQAGFEREVSVATAERTGRQVRGHFQVPLDVTTRGLTAGTAADGGHTVATNVDVGSFIDLLRNKMFLRQLGARVLSNLQGKLSIPKQTGSASTYWVPENGDVTGSKQGFGQVPMAPKTVGSLTDISRALLKQSSMSVEAFVQADLAQSMAQAIDLAGIAGTGADGQPTGILNTAGLTVHALGAAGAAIDWPAVVALETAVSTANADMNTMAYLTTPGVRGAMKQILKAAGVAGYLWDDGEVNGYGAFATNQMPADLTKSTGSNLHSMLFGDWSNLVIGEWGVLDMQVDTTTLGASGGLRVISLQDVDIAVRNIGGFAAVKDIVV